MTSVNTIPVNIPNTSYNNEVRLRQERIEEHYNAKKQIVERDREKRTLDKLLLEAYYAKLDQYAIYTRNSQLQRMEADQGKILDIEIK